MIRIDTFHERDGLTEHGDVTTHNAFDHLTGRQFAATEASALEIRIYYGGLFHTAIDGKSLVFLVVLRVFHDFVSFISH